MPVVQRGKPQEHIGQEQASGRSPGRLSGEVPRGINLQFQEDEVLFPGDIYINQLQDVGMLHPMGTGQESTDSAGSA